MARILIIEDEVEMAKGLKDNFEFDGDKVIVAKDGIDGCEKARTEHPDIIILDLMLPRMSGFDVVKELRGSGVTTPILILTARGQEVDKVVGLELGADDYMTKPFSVRELLARVKAILRRTGTTGNGTDPKVIGRLVVDFEKYTASDEHGEVELTQKEYEILRYLLAHADEAVSRDDLLNKVWGYNEFPTTRTIDNFIVRLRKRIEVDPVRPRHILTVHGMGYKLVP